MLLTNINIRVAYFVMPPSSSLAASMERDLWTGTNTIILPEKHCNKKGKTNFPFLLLEFGFNLPL